MLSGIAKELDSDLELGEEVHMMNGAMLEATIFHLVRPEDPNHHGTM
ncbi:MAG: hypothetical protein HW414_861 [Dehalococcoidia bacterium]|nr:hypothetical protein [Dehalococcoidia bacterium]